LLRVAGAVEDVDRHAGALFEEKARASGRRLEGDFLLSARGERGEEHRDGMRHRRRRDGLGRGGGRGEGEQKKSCSGEWAHRRIVVGSSWLVVRRGARTTNDER